MSGGRGHVSTSESISAAHPVTESTGAHVLEPLASESSSRVNTTSQESKTALKTLIINSDSAQNNSNEQKQDKVTQTMQQNNNNGCDSWDVNFSHAVMAMFVAIIFVSMIVLFVRWLVQKDN